MTDASTPADLAAVAKQRSLVLCRQRQCTAAEHLESCCKMEYRDLTSWGLCHSNCARICFPTVVLGRSVFPRYSVFY
jgi:hypothetical protein